MTFRRAEKDPRYRAAVLVAFDRMGVHLVRSEAPPNDPGWQFGPAGPGMNVSGGCQRVWLEHNLDHPEAWIWALHELEHVVFWRDDLSIEEASEQLMMPWGAAVLRAGGLSGRAYLESGYTSGTALPELWIGSRMLREVGDWKRPHRSAWYRRALAANIEAGTIAQDRMPTWHRPDWTKIRIEDHYET